MKIAVTTTFPNDYFDICAGEMLASFAQNWPEDVKLYIQLDHQSDQEHKAMHQKILHAMPKTPDFFLSHVWEEDQIKFIQQWKDHKPESYLFDVVKFSHKIFTVEKTADAVRDFDYDYLIWLDADVITHGKIDYEWLADVLPNKDQVVSCLQRNKTDNGVDYSECGFVAYNLKYVGIYDAIMSMKNILIDGDFQQLKSGWTDCHIFDEVFKDLPVKNLSDGAGGTNVWPLTKLAEKMEHRKGNRKIAKAGGGVVAQTVGNEPVIDANNLVIQTKNCVDEVTIRRNIAQNIAKIRHWAIATKADDRKVVICSAGPSLELEIDNIKREKEQGSIIVAVKHAMDTLRRNGVKPDFCVLLDPREHVEKFVTKPDKDVIYLVASMVDTSVIDSLNKNNCTIIGYQALVNVSMEGLVTPADMPVAGGSATSTRSIAIFSDMFGFKDFELYGYDLCFLTRPDMNEKNIDGSPRYFEIPMAALTYGDKHIHRTFWTEGQLLAQSAELQKLIKERKDLTINIHGDGMAGWVFKHWKLHEKYITEYKQRLESVRDNSLNFKDFINACSRGNEFSRKS